LKQQAHQHSDWLLVDQDESWFSRFEQPSAYGWGTVRLVERRASELGPDKALVCYGAVRQDSQQVYLYFSPQRPTSEQTWLFIGALLRIARREHKRVLVMIWDNAGWHISKRLRLLIRQYNRYAKHNHDVRLLIHCLPVKSPWLNPIEPRWVHAKRATCEPNAQLSVQELKRRLCAYFNTKPLKPSVPILH
jgi:hypothetical protein